MNTIVYFRNNPSILFWEAGNQVIAPAHMEDMVALRKQWDPHGGRVMGVRHGDNSAAAAAITPIAEYYGVMIGQDRRTDQLATPTAVFRGYSAERRDRAPLIETEDMRDEALRSLGYCVMRYDLKDLALLNVACETITAQQDDVAWGKLDRPFLNLSSLLHAKCTRDPVAPGM